MDAAPGPALSFSVLGEPLRLAEPGALRLLWIVAALAIAGAVALARRRAALREAAGALAGRVAPGANTARPALRVALHCASLALLALALARPQCGTATEVTRRPGVDLVLVLDASRSMLARDVAPDRLERSKLELSALLDALPGHRIGLVAFAASAYPLCPLTTDRAAVRLFLRGVDAKDLPSQGTALAEALRAAQELLHGAERGARSRALLLVSDGRDTASDVTPAVLKQKLVRSDVFLYAIGIDTIDARNSTRINPFTLNELTSQSGGYTEIIRSTAELGPATERIAEELNHQYLIGYTPLSHADGKYHSVRVRVTNEAYKVRARRGVVR